MKLPALYCLLMAIAVGCSGQCLTNSLIINTAYDPVTGAAINGGTNGGTPVTDPHWVLTSVSPGVAASFAITPIPGLIEVVPGNNADVISHGPSWAYNPFGNPGGWISCLNSNTYTTDGTGEATGTPYNMTLGRPFKMCGDDSIKFTFFIANDNYIHRTDIDGIPLAFAQAADTPVGNFSVFTPFTQTVYLTSGTHTVNVEVNNYNVPNVRPNPTGLDVYGTISSATGRNSLVSESDPACRSYVCSSVITPSTCDSVALPDTLRICTETSTPIPATLYGSDSVWSIRWSPAAGFSDTTILTPTYSSLSSQWLYVTVQSIMAGNLVTNGDFSAGNTGFTTSYSPEPAGSTCNGCSAVDINPYSYDVSWTSMGDHTTGTGKMLIIDGATTYPVNFWCESIPVTANTNYVFSFWMASTYPSSLPSIEVKINGLVAGTFMAGSTSGVWNLYQLEWNSGSATSADICMDDAVTVSFGNDLVIDDIALHQICTTRDSIYADITPSGITYGSRDTSICTSVTSITLNAPLGYHSYLWSTSATTRSVSADTGTYWVIATIPCATFIDTFHVIPVVPVISTTSKDTAICAGTNITLTAPQGYNSYSWSTGATTSFITVGSGAYEVTGAGNCSFVYDTFHIATIPLPVVALGNDTSICTGDSVTITAPQPDGSQYSWNTGDSGPSATVSAPGVYYLVVTMDGCSAADSINISAAAVPAVDLGKDTVLCSGDALTLNVNNSGHLLWSTGATDEKITVTATGNYWVTASNKCGSASDTINVDVEMCDLWIPSAFTPNDDGKNDHIGAVGHFSLIKDFSFSIYNRWGQLVFQTSYVYEGWDGKFNGVKQDLGTFFYIASYSLEGKKHTLKGNIELIR